MTLYKVIIYGTFVNDRRDTRTLYVTSETYQELIDKINNFHEGADIQSMEAIAKDNPSEQERTSMIRQMGILVL